MGGESIEQLAAMIARSKKIVFFGGAGMSTESGIPDFRSTYGIYRRENGRSYEEMLSIRYFLNHIDDFWRFYKDVMLYPDAKPNAGHIALARLEQQGRLRTIITQNIDGLHQEAGSRNVLELHGSVHRNVCMRCNKRFDLAYVLGQEGTPHCDQCHDVLRPEVVLYGEPLNADITDEATRAVIDCDLLIVGGTSLTVYPAAGLLGYRTGAKLVLINRDETPFDSRADLIVRLDIAGVLDTVIPKK